MIRRRTFAAIALGVFAVGSALYWNDWQFDLLAVGLNVFLGSVGFLILHHRWKRQEARALTPKKAKDVFS